MRFLKWTAIVLLLFSSHLYPWPTPFHTCLFSHNACCAVNRAALEDYIKSNEAKHKVKPTMRQGLFGQTIR